MARWLSGGLTEAERAEFEASSEYNDYIRLREGLNAFQKPTFDKERLRDALWANINQQKQRRTVRLRPFYYAAAIAATITVIIGLFFNKINYTTGIGEQLVVTLPDGTKVEMNASSRLTHNRFFWSDDKVVSLSGEANFNVIKGEGFAVMTDVGQISVLGTMFNVRSRESVFEVLCYEGRVLFESSDELQRSYLNAGDAIQLKDSVLLEFQHTDSGPLWKEGFSRFSNAAITEVMQELEVQYGITFDHGPSMLNGHFSGTFVHNDLQLALKAVFVPMGIEYRLADDQKTVILNVP